MEYKYIIERKRNGRAFTSCNGSRKFLRVMNNFQREKEGGVWRLKREREREVRPRAACRFLEVKVRVREREPERDPTGYKLALN